MYTHYIYIYIIMYIHYTSSFWSDTVGGEERRTCSARLNACYARLKACYAIETDMLAHLNVCYARLNACYARETDLLCASECMLCASECMLCASECMLCVLSGPTPSVPCYARLNVYNKHIFHSLCTYAHIYKCMYLYIYIIYLPKHTYIHIYTYIHVYINIYIYINIYTHTHLQKNPK